MRNLVAVAMVMVAVPTMVQAGDGPNYDTLNKTASRMTSTEIKAHNKTLAATDANYIRCRRQAEIGSLVRKSRTCKTNADWSSSFATGNQDARETIDAMSRAPINSSN